MKKSILKNLAILTGKHVCWSLFLIKSQTLRPATLLKKRLQDRCFPLNTAKVLRIPVLKKICERLLLQLVS